MNYFKIDLGIQYCWIQSQYILYPKSDIFTEKNKENVLSLPIFYYQQLNIKVFQYAGDLYIMTKTSHCTCVTSSWTVFFLLSCATEFWHLNSTKVFQFPEWSGFGFFWLFFFPFFLESTVYFFFFRKYSHLIFVNLNLIWTFFL